MIWLIVILIVIFIVPFFVSIAEEKSDLKKHLDNRPSEPIPRDYKRLEDIDKKLKGGVHNMCILEFHALMNEVISIRDQIKKYDNWRYQLEMYEWKR